MTRFGGVLATGLIWASSAPAQTGFTTEGKGRQRALESELVAGILPADLDAMARVLAAAPHVAGTAGQSAVRDTLLAWLGTWGLEREVATYEVFLPHAVAVELALTAPESVAFRLVEDPIPGDPVTALEAYPWVNGYSAPGRIEAEVVYAGYGLHGDYERLAELGVDVRGRVVIARYGRAYRGVKARLAAERGAGALLLYSDPDDDGYVQGDIYPEGPWRPWSGVQRGSVLDGDGDPATPDGPSLSGAPRLDGDALADRVPDIPVLPISYRVAGEILSRVRGADLPEPGWQGALAFRYHVGPGPARVRVRVDDDRRGPRAGVKSIHDVVATIRGTDWPEEVVVIGAHIDAWGAGANDNVSGTASVLAAARAIRSAAAAGNPPRRTIVIAGWDGEEWGLLGSTEWAEEHAGWLAAGGVAYLNQDAVGGTRFEAGAAPLLAASLREAAGAVPGRDGSLLDEWRAGEAEAEVGDLGGGSDFEPFYQRLGIPSASYGFGSAGGVYHSAYDTYRWMIRFGDPGYRNHARVAQLTAVLALRLANAEILPYDVAGLAGRLDSLWAPLETMAVAETGAAGDELEPLDRALDDLLSAGAELGRARERYLAGRVDAATSARANRILIGIERALGREPGPFGDGSVRSLTFASDPLNGYATLVLPGVAAAVRERSRARVQGEVADLADRLRFAAERAREAARLLGRGSPERAGSATFIAPRRRAVNPRQEVDAW